MGAHVGVAKMIESRFWVYDWLEERGIRSERDVARVLGERPLYNEFRLAAEQMGSVRADRMDSRASLVAGAGLDLTGEGVCVHPNCIHKQVDDLFRHAWLYFDKVRVSDLTPSFARTTYRKLDESDKLQLAGWLGALLYLKSIGAESFVDFAQKPRYCAEHWEQHANEFGLSNISNDFDHLLEAFAQEVELTVAPHRNPSQVRVGVKIPKFSGWRTYIVAKTWLASKDQAELTRNFVERRLAEGIERITVDLAKSRVAGASLGTTSDEDRFYLQYSSKANEINVGNVAFNLNLPVIEDFPVADLLKVRKDEAALFAHFQDTLRSAIKERIAAGQASSAAAVAAEIVDDLIKPGINEIRLALEKASKSLGRNYLAAGVSAVATTVGALSHQLPVLSVGAAACSASLGAILRARQDRDIVETRPMYFVFKALEHAPH